MAKDQTQPSSWMKKGNFLAAAVVAIAFGYIIFHKQTPPAPLDRTVYSTKTQTGASERDSVSRESTDSVKTASDSENLTTSGSTNPQKSSTGSETLKPKTSSSDTDSSLIPEDSPEDIPDTSLTASGATGSGTTESGIVTYYNSYLDYGLSVPKGAYYAGYGSKDGAAHSMGFTTGTGVVDFDTAEVKLWYFPSKILPELKDKESGFYQDPSTNMTYLKLGDGTIKLEGNMENPILLKIIETVNRGD